MKVLLFNGSAHLHGCTYTALKTVAGELEDAGIETEIIQLGSDPIRDCTGCGRCRSNRCAYTDDLINPILEKAEQADGFVFGTPVYYAHPSGRLLSVMDRLFFAGGSLFAHKPAAAIASARRAGQVVSLDAIEKHFTISQMPVVSSTYWNLVYGSKPEDLLQDQEGLQTMRNLGRNMAWLLHCIEQGQTPPQAERGNRTNFVR